MALGKFSWAGLFRLVVWYLTNGTWLNNCDQGISSAFIRDLTGRNFFRVFGDENLYFQILYFLRWLRRFDKSNFAVTGGSYFLGNVFRFASVTVPNVHNRFLTDNQARTSENFIVLFTGTNCGALD